VARIGLHIIMPDGRTLAREFDSDTILIGSGPSAVLKLDDPEVSSIHAVLKATPEGVVTVVDLGSEAGTTVNGRAVTEPMAVKSGDELALGRVRIKVLLPERAHVHAEPRPHPSTPPKQISQPPPMPAKPSAPPQMTKRPSAPAELRTELIDDLSAPTTGKVDTRSAMNRPLAAQDDLKLSVLKKPLDESNKPNAQQHCLEVSVMWGDTIIDSVLVREPRAVTVTAGQMAKGDLHVETDLPVPKFTIAHNAGTEATIIVPSDAKVGLRKADGSITRDVALQGADAPFPAKSYRLGFGERIAFKAGTLTYVAQFVKGEAELSKVGTVDWFFPRIFAISALLHAFFVVAAFVTPKLSSTLTDDLFKQNNRFAQMILKAPEKEKQRKKLDLSGAKGAKHKDEEGKFGKKDKPKQDKLASKAGAPRVDPNKREKDRKIALNSGLLGMLGKSGAVSNVFGPGGLGSGINNAMGGLQGTEMGDAGGAGGLGTRGSGAGGGGNSLGIGGLGTHGHGRGSGGYGNIDLGGRGKGETRIVPGKTIVQGALSKEEIGRVIRRNLARFKYCYEKQLNANPNLAGKIAIYFTIAPTGSVADASVRETSMNDNNVEECALKVMRSLKFPQPRGGGVVVVTYPFVFASNS
jgi:TonB family protein